MGNFIQQKMRVQLGTECHMSLGSLYLHYRMVLYNFKKMIHFGCILEIVKICVLRKEGSFTSSIITVPAVWKNRMLSDCIFFHNYIPKSFFLSAFLNWVLKSV